MFACLRRIEHIGYVGKELDCYTELFCKAFDFTHVGRLHPSGYDVDLVELFAGIFRELFGHGSNHVSITGDV